VPPHAPAGARTIATWRNPGSRQPVEFAGAPHSSDRANGVAVVAATTVDAFASLGPRHHDSRGFAAADLPLLHVTSSGAGVAVEDTTSEKTPRAADAARPSRSPSPFDFGSFHRSTRRMSGGVERRQSLKLKGVAACRDRHRGVMGGEKRAPGEKVLKE
jgi:hypothetical protein